MVAALDLRSAFQEVGMIQVSWKTKLKQESERDRQRESKVEAAQFLECNRLGPCEFDTDA